MVYPSTKLNAVNILARSLWYVCFNIISLCATRLPEWPSSFRFPHQSPVYIFPPPHVPRAQLLFITLITFGQQYQSWRSSFHNFLELRVTSSILSSTSPSTLLCPNITPSTLLRPNIPPAPCYVPILLPAPCYVPTSPQHPVTSQHPPSTLLCPNYPLISPHPTILSLCSDFHNCQQEINSKSNNSLPFPMSLILPSLLLKKKFNL